MTPSFGRLHAPDPRDKQFPMRLMLDPLREQFFPRGLPPGTRYYPPGAVLDQGPTGTCVGHGWAGFLQGAPLMSKPTVETAPFAIYDACIKADEWSDNDVDPDRQFGTSVRAGAKVLAALGLVQRYLWAESVEDVRAWHLSGFGTVVFGVNWYAGMLKTDSKGFVHISGDVVGGHCIKSTGWSDDRRALRIQNSWSAEWGEGGRAWIGYEDLARLIAEDGEACAAVEQKAAKP